MLSTLAGFQHYSDFSALINRPVVVASARNIERLQRIAALVEFPSDAIFIDEPLTEQIPSHEAKP